jgi:ABC-2 type transport system permease protein
MNTSLPSMHLPDARILPGVWKLVLMRLRITYNSFRHAKLGRKIGTIVVWLGLLALAFAITSFSRFLLGLAQSPEIAGYTGTDLKPFLASIPVLTLSALFIGTLLTSFGVLLQALYLSGDMDFLLASPIPIRSVFIAKLLQAVLPNFGLIALFGIPILFGLGISNNYNFIYYPLVLILMIALALSAAGLSSLLVMAVVRVLPPRRAAEILGFIGALIGFSFSQMGNFGHTVGKSISASGAQFTSLLMRANTPWLPLNWAGQGLVALGEGRWLSGLFLLGATLGLASFAFWFALVTAERLFYSGWAGMQVVARKKTTRTRQASQSDAKNPALGLLRFIPTPVLGIVQKDSLTLKRDLRNLSQLVSPIILGVVYTFAILRNGGEPPPGQGEAPTWFMDSFRVVMAYSSVGMSLFVGWMILSRLAGMAFSHEGKNYWMLKVSPVRISHLLAAKFIVAYLPPLGLGLIFLTVISIAQKLSILEFAYSLIAIIMCLAGSAGILLAFGALGANFTWDDPRRINAGGMGCLGQIITMLYLPVSFGIFVAPIGLVGFFNIPILYGYLIGLIFGTGITAACAFIPLWLVRKRVERLNEE